ncbi:hypothetical protein W59_22760 [Rhodococcus opacus RKJ300 = JCM 13270]|uniref:Uncharacterized protein n=1 Tax=Rhodococcus opacus RKJ300 = JCM 13270 TaxID=1165867 RepID=I0WM97_RHOOP|nr:hypothetical protein W59_22760 [Rhodococcus opacus RKJ300 = JCM 13270]
MVALMISSACGSNRYSSASRPSNQSSPTPVRSGGLESATCADHHTVPSGAGMWRKVPLRARTMLNVPVSAGMPPAMPETL